MTNTARNQENSDRVTIWREKQKACEDEPILGLISEYFEAEQDYKLLDDQALDFYFDVREEYNFSSGKPALHRANNEWRARSLKEIAEELTEGKIECLNSEDPRRAAHNDYVDRMFAKEVRLERFFVGAGYPAVRDKADAVGARKQEVLEQISATPSRSLAGVLAKLRMVGNFEEWQTSADNRQSRLVAPAVGLSTIADLERLIGEMRPVSDPA